VHVERKGEALDCFQPHRPLTVLDQADVRSVQARGVGKTFLGQLFLLAQAAHVVAEVLPERAPFHA
jgi:hypothetical protein